MPQFFLFVSSSVRCFILYSPILLASSDARVESNDEVPSEHHWEVARKRARTKFSDDNQVKWSVAGRPPIATAAVVLL